MDGNHRLTRDPTPPTIEARCFDRRQVLPRSAVASAIPAAAAGAVLLTGQASAQSNPATPAPPTREAIVATRYGKVRGSVADGVYTFKGIPFAAPPFGPNRLRPPQPAEPWSGVRDVLTF